MQFFDIFQWVGVELPKPASGYATEPVGVQVFQKSSAELTEKCQSASMVDSAAGPAFIKVFNTTFGMSCLWPMDKLKEKLVRLRKIIYVVRSFTTGPHNGPVPCFALCCLSSVGVVCNAAGGRAGRRARGRSDSRHCTAGQYGYVPLWLHLVSNVAATRLASSYSVHTDTML